MREPRLQTAREAGFRMPPEWAPHSRTWMQWPYRDGFIWPDLGRTQAACARIARAIRHFEPVTMIVRDEDLRAARAMCGAGIDYLVMPLDDSWARDSGPVFLKSGNELAATVFQFNAWGRKYPQYRHDAAVAHRVCEYLGVPTFTSDIVMEGGGICVDGEGTILTSESCVLNSNRNPGLGRVEAERILCEALGGDKVIWVPGDPEDFETDGHIDAIACFLKPGVILCATGHPENSQRARDLHENWKALQSTTDAAGRTLELVPMGEAWDAESISDRFCASFLNFYFVNGGVIFPGFGTPSDSVAQSAIRALVPEREVVVVDVNDIAVGGGGIHCITQQQPS